MTKPYIKLEKKLLLKEFQLLKNKQKEVFNDKKCVCKVLE